jgi:hypothetical protein
MPSLLLAGSGTRATAATETKPLLVELFTSEGCSSCPPADRLLEKIDTGLIVPGVEAIVLSEHVDYWDTLGWKDPFSSSEWSDRQRVYARRLGVESIYTPQMIVDGKIQFVGNDTEAARSAMLAASARPKIHMRIASAVRKENDFQVTVEIDGGSLGKAQHESELYVGIAGDHVSSRVTRGENSGRDLTHVAVLRRLKKASHVDLFHGSTPAIVPMGSSRSDENIRVVAFLQQGAGGPIVGVTAKRLS